MSSLSLVRCRGNDYSVPVAYGHREVLIRCYVDEVVNLLRRGGDSYDSEDLIFDPLHYLPLIEQKIGALDQAAPLAGWNLPEAFITRKPKAAGAVCARSALGRITKPALCTCRAPGSRRRPPSRT